MKVKLLKRLRKETFKTFKEALENYKHLWHRFAYDYIQEKERECNLKYPW